ncbi:MAG: IPT/TIG domain-containing protein [Acidimicrobiales bacterium]
MVAALVMRAVVAWMVAVVGLVSTSLTTAAGAAGAAATCTPLTVSDGYRTSVDAALAGRRDVWAEEAMARPEGPTYDNMKDYLKPLNLSGLAGVGTHYVAVGQPNGATGPELALHTADGARFYSETVLDDPARVPNTVTLMVGAAGDERYGSCHSRRPEPVMPEGLPILQTEYVDGDGFHHVQESFAVRQPGVPLTGGRGDIVSWIRLTVHRGTATSTTATVKVLHETADLRRSGNALVKDSRTHLAFSGTGATYDAAAKAVRYSLDVSAGAKTVYLVRLNQPGVLTGALVADRATYDQARARLRQFWTDTLGRGATFSVPEERVTAAQRNLLVQNLLMGRNYSVGNKYQYTWAEQYNALATLGRYGHAGEERRLLVELMDWWQHPDGSATSTASAASRYTYTAGTPPAAPPATVGPAAGSPTGLAVTTVTPASPGNADGKAALSWTGVPGAGSYRVYARRPLAGGTWLQWITGVTGTTVTAFGLSQGSWEFTVRAVTNGAESGDSNLAWADLATGQSGASTAPPSTGPQVTSVSPAGGPPGGGTVVTVTGTDLTGGTVRFGTAPATAGSCSLYSCSVTAPPGSGTVDVTVSAPRIRPGTEGLLKGAKLMASAQYYLRTRDGAFLDSYTPLFTQWLEEFKAQMAADPNGLLKKGLWAGDISDPDPGCYALSYGQSHGYAGMGEIVDAWSAKGRGDLASKYGPLVTTLRQSLRAAIDASKVTLGDGSLFVPPCLLSGMQPHDPLTATNTGSYWNLVMQSPVAMGLFEPGGDEARRIEQYLSGHGSRLLGMVRFTMDPPSTMAGYQTAGVDTPYGYGLAEFLAQNDKPDHLVAGLYGHLAHGLTRGTYVGGEGNTVRAVPGEFYRQLNNPPNSVTNATVLNHLRVMLLHETGGGLRLAHATPRGWLEPGRKISVAGAPSEFGPVTYTIERPSADPQTVRGEVVVPSRLGGRRLSLRVRVPAGLTMSGVTVNGAAHAGFDPADETIDLTGRTGTLQLVVRYAGSSSTTAPTGLTITSRTSSTAGLAWNPVAGASEYRAYVSPTSGSGYFLWASGFTGSSATLFSLTGDYYVVVRAVVHGVESPNSNQVHARADGTIGPSASTTTTTTTVTTTMTTAPPSSSGAPTGLTVTSRTASTVGLRWNAVAGAGEYRAYVSRTSGSGYFLWASGFTGTTATLYSLTGDFYVVVRAVVGGVESANSNQVLARADGTVGPSPATTTTTRATTATTAPPPSSSSPAPTGLTITSRTSSTAGLAWNPVAGATEYRAYVSRTSGSGYFLWASGFTGTTATLYSLTGDFYVVVRAVVAGVESANSNEVLARAP